MKIVLYSPVRQSPEVLRETMASHRALSGVSERWYVDDCDVPEASELLKAEAKADGRVRVFDSGRISNLPERTTYRVDDSVTHVWTDKLMARMAALRDFGIQRALKAKADALFIIDSDVLAHPGLVEHLYGLRLDVVSEVYWSQWYQAEPWLPNVWDFGAYGMTGPDRVVRLREPGIYKVGGLGAVTLISRAALLKGLRYELMPSLEHPGEDRHFCTRAAGLDIELFADTHFPCFHVYRPSLQLEEARAWRQGGCDPSYWRNRYLTDEWVKTVETNFLASPGVRPKTIACMLPGENFHSLWVSHWSTLLAEMSKRFSIAMAWGYTSNCYATRNMLAQCVLDTDTKPDYVFWLDDDQICTVETFNLLMTALVAHPEADIVCGASLIQADAGGPTAISCGRMEEGRARVQPFTWKEFQAAAERRELLECDYTGFPVVLMRGSAAERIGSKAFTPILTPGSTWGFSGEDVAWSMRAKDAGLRIFCEPRAMSPHMKLRAVQPAFDEVGNEVQEESGGLAMAAD